MTPGHRAGGYPVGGSRAPPVVVNLATGLLAGGRTIGWALLTSIAASAIVSSRMITTGCPSLEQQTWFGVGIGGRDWGICTQPFDEVCRGFVYGKTRQSPGAEGLRKEEGGASGIGRERGKKEREGTRVL